MQGLNEFWKLVVDVWTQGMFGIDIGRVLTALLIMAAFFLLRGLFTRFVLAWLHAVARRTRSSVDDTVIEALEQPLRFVPVALGAFFAVDYLKLDQTYREIGDHLVRSLIAFIIFWAFWRLVQPAAKALRYLETVFTAELLDWLVKAMKVAVVLVGVATILQIWGIQVGPIIAGAGLFGVAVALGAQDLFKNLISGILILGEKRFKNGDWILVDGVVEGTVETIGFRSTVVRRFDKAPVLVPNSKLSDTAVTNFSGATHRRIYWTIGVEYRTTTDQLRRIRDAIDAYIIETDDFAPQGEVNNYVRVGSFGPSSIDILVSCFTRATRWSEMLEVKERLAYRVMDIIAEAGTSFAFPSQSLYVESLPGATPEIFTPPTAEKGADTSDKTEERKP